MISQCNGEFLSSCYEVSVCLKNSQIVKIIKGLNGILSNFISVGLVERFH